MKLQYKYLLTSLILIAVYTSCKKEDNYPIELKLVEIDKGVIKAYTQQDSIIPNNYTYDDVVNSLYFNSILVRKINFRRHNAAFVSLGSESTGYLNLNATVNYFNDSIIFKVDDTINGNRISQELRGIGNEQGVELYGTTFIILYPNGLNGLITYKFFNLEKERNELGSNDTLVFFHFKLKYE